MPCRDKISEQNALSDEIVNAITSNTIGEQVDDAALDAELAELQQEQLDEQMLSAGNVPVADAVHKMPSPSRAERKCSLGNFVCCVEGGADIMAAISSKKVAIEEDDEEAELRKLQAEMAM
jgi:charged multivesicular body protein 4